MHGSGPVAAVEVVSPETPRRFERMRNLLLALVSPPTYITPRQRFKRTLWISLVTVALVIAFVIVAPAIPQSQEYHNFADDRDALGLPNALNVLSNVVFLIVGLIGLRYFLKRTPTDLSEAYSLHQGPQSGRSDETNVALYTNTEWGAWLVFYFGVTLVSIGSSYYHWVPNNGTIVWDRMPMTVSFMTLLAILIAERVGQRAGKWVIIPLVLQGMGSVLLTVFVDDLRWYIVVQALPCILLLPLMRCYPNTYTHSYYYLYAGGAYLFAKIVEFFDQALYDAITVSGHTLKHLLAAATPAILLAMLVQRRFVDEEEAAPSFQPLRSGPFQHGTSKIRRLLDGSKR
eukprot:GFYU01012722.1.p1 GENE.GFYU01012722.1~~GFYU01012722.1.p1  ORF type:complete len:344 (+),score=17.87 GFYU01012722.1:154-1185(+)